MVVDDGRESEICFVQYLREQVRNSYALWKDAVEHRDRKGTWHAKGALEMADKVLNAHLTNGPNW